MIRNNGIKRVYLVQSGPHHHLTCSRHELDEQLLIYLLLNSGSTGAYHSIMYGDFSMLIAGINIYQNLPYPVNK
jgi:hypothetical protein